MFLFEVPKKKPGLPIFSEAPVSHFFYIVTCSFLDEEEVAISADADKEVSKTYQLRRLTNRCKKGIAYNTAIPFSFLFVHFIYINVQKSIKHPIFNCLLNIS